MKNINGAVLAAVKLKSSRHEENFEISFCELERLVETLGFEIVKKITQNRDTLCKTSVVGPGKLEEIAKLVKPLANVKYIIFDHELSTLQLRTIERATGKEVLDRPAVILEIFSKHARTKEAQLQVEIARAKYLTPTERDSGSRNRSEGSGESASEIARRRVRDRITELQRELKEIQKDQATRRRLRKDQLKVGIVGYTNAGKSSLMRALTASDVLVADQLFATLDTTVRALQPETTPRILISDTVGFIRNLPHDLVASFRSTLDEALDASLLLHVVDSSDSAFRSQIEVTENVLKEIGANNIPCWLVLNKIDRVEKIENLLREFPDAYAVSAIDPKSVEAFRSKVISYFFDAFTEEEILIPYGKENIIGEIRKNTHVLSESYRENGLTLKVKGDPKTLNSIKKRMAA
jgi:GTPase